uniref:Phosphatidylinositol glycan anchor biosynthesis class B n=1 Tax=Myotis myotis TaxID=51298 RepID=A0A7J8APZ4_MYOMY|nr:phosphatidylinositol glycan anchor biosynthesis class B [Myotis myotis]
MSPPLAPLPATDPASRLSAQRRDPTIIPAGSRSPAHRSPNPGRQQPGRKEVPPGKCGQPSAKFSRRAQTCSTRRRSHCPAELAKVALSRLPLRPPGRQLAEAKLSAPRSGARSPTSRRKEARDLQHLRNGAGARRRQPLLPRPPEPLPREGEAAEEKVGLVPQPPGERPAPRSSW